MVISSRYRYFLARFACFNHHQCGFSALESHYKKSEFELKSLALVAVGGITGTLVRYWLSLVIPSDRTGTLAANLIGVTLAAFLLVLMERRGITEIRLLLLPGFCAGLTTFSAVTVHTLEPSKGGALYLLVNLISSLAIVAIVLPLARRLIPARK